MGRTSITPGRYRFDHGGVNAEFLVLEDKSCRVAKGARAPAKARNFSGQHLDRELDKAFARAEAEGKMVFDKENNQYLLTQDLEFASANEAANFLYRGNLSARQFLRPISLRFVEPKTESSRRKIQKFEHPSTWEINGWKRNKTIADEAKLKAGFRCQACNFSFEERYGEVGTSFLEAHHLFPLSSRARSEIEITAGEIIALCANCHRIVHRLLANGVATETNQLEVLKSIIRSTS